jgi:hypothetical protein
VEHEDHLPGDDEVREREPDPFSEPGEPLRWEAATHAGEVVETGEIERTKDENFAELASAFKGGVAAVPPEAVEKAGFSWRDWNYWIRGMLEHQERTEGFLVAYGAMQEEGFEWPARVKDRVGLIHLVDSDLGRYWTQYWKDHPDETPPGE